MDNKIGEMDLDELLAQRSQKLNNDLGNYDSKSAGGTNSNGTSATPDIDAAELNYVRQYLNSVKANTLVEKLTRLRDLKKSRTFLSSMGQAAVTKVENSVISDYKSAIEKSGKSISLLHLKCLLFIILGIIFLGGAIVSFIFGLSTVVSIIILVISLFFFGSLPDIKDDINEIRDAKKSVLAASKIAKVKGNTIVF